MPAACSAIFVHDVAKQAANTSKQHSSDIISPRVNDESDNKPRKRKRTLDATDTPSQTRTITLHDVRQCIENNGEKFDFLSGLTEDLSEAKAPGYAAAIKRNLKRQSNNGSGRKLKVAAASGKNSGIRRGKKTDALEVAVGSINETNVGEKAINDHGVDGPITSDVATLRRVINDAQLSNSFVEDIVEDDDEYD